MSLGYAKIDDCAALARKWGCDQVVVLAIKHEAETVETISYGETRALSDAAEKVANQIHHDVVNGIIEIPRPSE